LIPDALTGGRKGVRDRRRGSSHGRGRTHTSEQWRKQGVTKDHRGDLFAERCNMTRPNRANTAANDRS
jgi:hypothetical protein